MCLITNMRLKRDAPNNEKIRYVLFLLLFSLLYTCTTTCYYVYVHNTIILDNTVFSLAYTRHVGPVSIQCFMWERREAESFDMTTGNTPNHTHISFLELLMERTIK